MFDSKFSSRGVIRGIIFLALVMAVGTAWFVLVEDHSFLDGLYMTVITIATVGYGEVHIVSQAGRMFIHEGAAEPPGKHDHVVIETDGGHTIIYQDARRFGTLPFAHLARGGFVAATLMRSAVANGLIDEIFLEHYFSSISTVAKDFVRDGAAVAAGFSSGVAASLAAISGRASGGAACTRSRASRSSASRADLTGIPASQGTPTWHRPHP